MGERKEKMRKKNFGRRVGGCEKGERRRKGERGGERKMQQEERKEKMRGENLGRCVGGCEREKRQRREEREKERKMQQEEKRSTKKC